jgi:hypothetical protein
MVFKLSEAAAKKWRRLNGAELVRDVIDGVQRWKARRGRRVVSFLIHNY